MRRVSYVVVFEGESYSRKIRAWEFGHRSGKFKTSLKQKHFLNFLSFSVSSLIALIHCSSLKHDRERKREGVGIVGVAVVCFCCSSLLPGDA